MQKKLVDKLVKKCGENIHENEMISVSLNDYESVCGSFAIYIALFFIAFLIIMILVVRLFIFIGY